MLSRSRRAGAALLAGLALLQPWAARALDCPAPALQVLPLGPDLWWVASAVGDSDSRNRGHVSNIVLARQGQGPTARLWALGSGPTAAFGRALGCQVREQLGLPISDVISPWARPELVLGVAGLLQATTVPPGAQSPLRHWGHARVAEAMAEQCAHCAERLRQRLQEAAGDVGDLPIHLPDHRLQGEQGRLGPFDWWLLPRTEGRWVTVWRHHDRPLWVAHGLLQGEGPPDGRDADLALLLKANQRLAELAQADGASARFVAEQGPLLPAGAPARHATYWARLLDQARAAVDRGDDESAPAPGWPGLPDGWAAQPWHGFNWQRAWRQVEDQVMAAPSR